jgi:hypothetical protein
MSYFTVTFAEGYVVRLGADADLGHLYIDFPHGGTADIKLDLSTLQSTCTVTADLNHDVDHLSHKKNPTTGSKEDRGKETVSSKTPRGSSITFAAVYADDGTRPMDPPAP